MEGTDPGSAGLSGRRWFPLWLVLSVALGAVVSLGVSLVVHPRSDDPGADVRQQALSVARQEAVNLTTISYLTADRDLGRIIARATGSLRTQFEGQRQGFPTVLTRDKSVSVGNVLAAAVSSQSGTAVQVLVAVDATVTSQPVGATSTSVVKHYWMDMRVTRVADRWLVSQVAFAGVPQ